MKLARSILWLPLLIACSHEAARDNPLDPDLAPAVAVFATVDDSTGNVALAWGRYSGRSDFGHYVVLRNQAQSTVVDSLAWFSSSQQTSFLDTTAQPNTAYEYRISVATSAGLEIPSEPARVGGYRVEAVELLDLEVDTRRVEVRLRWRRFLGAGFEAYRVERRLVGAEDDFVPVHRSVSAMDTTFADAGVVPDARYIYQVVVEAAGQDWASNRTGREGLTLSEVVLPVASDDAATGTIALRWPRYEGAGFQAYRVVRRAPDGSSPTVHESVDATDTTYVDSMALSGVVYAYSLIVQAGDRVITSAPIEARVLLPVVDLQTTELTSNTASARLTWSHYAGPRFQAYRIERRTQTLAGEVVAVIEDAAAVTWVDSSLDGNTEYFYRIVVLTSLGETLASEERSGIIHPLVASWPLEVADDEYVRLYTEPGGGVTALVSNETRVRLLAFGTAGDKTSERVLWEAETSRLRPASAATAILADGSRVLSQRLYKREWAQDLTVLTQVDAGGEVRRYDRSLLPEEFVIPADGTESTGAILFSAFRGFMDDVIVTADGQTVASDDFDNPDNSVWDLRLGTTSDGYLGAATRSGTIIHTDSSWHNVSIEATARLDDGGRLTMRVGAPNGANLVAGITADSVVASWRFDLGQATQRLALDLPTPVGWNRIRLGIIDGLPTFSMSHPPLYEASANAQERHVTVAALQDWVAVVDGSRPSLLTPGQQKNRYAPLDGVVSELRIWSGPTRPWTGACVPEQHQVIFAPVSISPFTGALNWPLGPFARSVGRVVGQLPGSLLFPLSLDGAPDGRIYVLDAGNARIQVFDTGQNYLTQWGISGSEPGQFDFGEGRSAEDFSGSVAVDDEGFIYVADVGNRRIQKFAP